MRAIQTKILPVTMTKPFRVKAYASCGTSVTVSRDAYERLSDAEDGAVKELCKELGFKGTLVRGDIASGAVYVFVERSDRVFVGMDSNLKEVSNKLLNEFSETYKKLAK